MDQRLGLINKFNPVEDRFRFRKVSSSCQEFQVRVMEQDMIQLCSRIIRTLKELDSQTISRRAKMELVMVCSQVESLTLKVDLTPLPDSQLINKTPAKVNITNILKEKCHKLVLKGMLDLFSQVLEKVEQVQLQDSIAVLIWVAIETTKTLITNQD